MINQIWLKFNGEEGNFTNNNNNQEKLLKL